VTPRVVAIGVGNEYRRDDAVGLIVARRLRALAPDGVAIVEAEGEGTALLEAWRGADAVFVVDAVRSAVPAGRRRPPPGTLHRLDAHAGRLSAGLFHASTHAVNLADAVELARALGELPPRFVVYGIEADGVGAGSGLSQPVGRAVEPAVEALLREIAALEEAEP
jgi:hydrogenase maturation protease